MSLNQYIQTYRAVLAQDYNGVEDNRCDPPIELKSTKLCPGTLTPAGDHSFMRPSKQIEIQQAVSQQIYASDHNSVRSGSGIEGKEKCGNYLY